MDLYLWQNRLYYRDSTSTVLIWGVSGEDDKSPFFLFFLKILRNLGIIKTLEYRLWLICFGGWSCTVSQCTLRTHYLVEGEAVRATWRLIFMSPPRPASSVVSPVLSSLFCRYLVHSLQMSRLLLCLSLLYLSYRRVGILYVLAGVSLTGHFVAERSSADRLVIDWSLMTWHPLVLCISSPILIVLSSSPANHSPMCPKPRGDKPGRKFPVRIPPAVIRSAPLPNPRRGLNPAWRTRPKGGIIQRSTETTAGQAHNPPQSHSAHRQVWK